MLDEETPGPPIGRQSPLAQALIVLLFGLLGMGMILQGLGWHGMDFLRPNPAIPPLAFVLVGVFALCAALIVAFQALAAPARVVGLAAGSMVAAAVAMTNWMVLFSGGHAGCFIGPVPGFVLGSLGTSACDWMARALVLLIDAILALVLGAAVLRRLTPGTPG